MADWGSKHQAIDIILGVKECPCVITQIYSAALTGKCRQGDPSLAGHSEGGLISPRVLKVTPVENRADILLQRFWEVEELPLSSSTLTTEEAKALTTSRKW